MNLWDELAKPFPENKVHWRVGATNGDKTKGIALAYVDARDVMDRLDMVVGPENWQCRYPFVGCCEIGIRVNGEWVWKSNGAGTTDVEGEKGQFSDAFKRAGVMLGIARYLYALPNEWVEIVPAGRSYKLKSPPKLPAWATPNGWHRISAEARREVYAQTVERLSDGDSLGLKQIWDEWDNDEKAQLWSMFDSKQRSAMKELLKGEAA